MVKLLVKKIKQTIIWNGFSIFICDLHTSSCLRLRMDNRQYIFQKLARMLAVRIILIASYSLFFFEVIFTLLSVLRLANIISKGIQVFFCIASIVIIDAEFWFFSVQNSITLWVWTKCIPLCLPFIYYKPFKTCQRADHWYTSLKAAIIVFFHVSSGVLISSVLSSCIPFFCW